MNNANKKSKHATGASLELRVLFLIEHPEFMEGAPSDTDDVDDPGRAKLDRLVALFRDRSEIGKGTPDATARDGVRRSVGIARKRIAHAAKQPTAAAAATV